MALKFQPIDAATHTCVAERQGEWVVFTCPLCKGFQRRLNYVTGEMRFSAGADPHIRHEGTHQPPGFEVGGTGLN